MLDNCEHLIEAVAELVAFLVSTTADLRVLTTSRAPLAIAAERVYLLGELDAGDAARLFSERAVAARPSVQLTGPLVTSIVARLDGLPLAIELAAARVRTMSLEEIDRRLEDRFALLRGGDRSAPDRHQTLLAVIDWSWNLLNAAERRALRRLALFHDGFTLDAAEAVLGDDAVEAVQGLVDQSLLSVAETPAGGRYRMLETVREFGQMRLADAGEDAAARAAQRRWAAAYASHQGARIAEPRPVRGHRRARRRGEPTWPTSCAARSPTVTAARSSSCLPRSGCSGRSAASTPGLSSWPQRSPTRCATGSRRLTWRTRPARR